MNAVILACTTLTDYVLAAQETCRTSYPVVWLDRQYHIEPQQMREKILSALSALPEEVDTVLVSMGFCGGSWQDVTSSKRIVIPRVDDCVSLVMTTTDEVKPCTKEIGHMYVFGGSSGGFSIGGIYDSLRQEYDEETAQIVFDMMFANYRNMDIVDTGLYDCYDLAYVERVQADADRIHGELDYVDGSNLLLEKLLSGRWDRQFLVAEPGTTIGQGIFFDV